ncbi:UvrD-helicase domain-containing protein [Halorubellus litoreus]|uniref:DNA 3'-5' helicase n=1 Tax=Halorubellus litoreus TaxID=755308 RepID=A0ABD5VLQ4_9EURY
MQPSDLTDEQRHAVGTTRANYPLIAGAGTGKTTTLSFRYVALLEQNPDLRPREILVTTFTKRAARDLVGAIRERVLDRITSADPDDTTDIERWRQVLDELTDAYVHTLHAFCQRILEEHALDAPGIQPGFELVDDVEGAELQADSIDEFIAAQPPCVQTLLDANLTSESGLHNILSDLFSERPRSRDWATYWADSEHTADEYIEHVEATFHPLPDDDAQAILSKPALRAAVDSLRSFLADPPTSDPGTSIGRIEDVIECIDAAGGLGGPQTPAARRRLIADLSDILTKSGGGTYADYSPKQGGWNASTRTREEVGETVEELVAAVEAERWQEALGDVDLDVDRQTTPLVFALATAFDTVAERYQERKRNQNLVDYTDLVQTTQRLLTADAGAGAVRAALQAQFEYVMIDEVQDTDPSQWEIVGELTRLGADSGHYSGENVFVVGDEKQSIFRFRGADVAVFEASRTELVTANTQALAALVDEDLAVRVRTGDRPGFELAANFRTLPGTLEFINALFSGIFDADTPDRDPFEAPPQPLTAARDNPANIETIPEYLLVPDEDLAPDVLDESHPLRTQPAYHTRSNEAHAVAARITTLVDDHTQIYDTTAPNADVVDTESVSFDDIAVILRKRTHLQAFKHAFEEYDIPYTVVKGDGFFETPEVETLLNLLDVLVDPHAEIPLYGVLRSPLFGIEDDILAHALATADADSAWARLHESDDPAITRAIDVLEHARTAGGCDGSPATVDAWSTLVEEVLERTGYRASVSADARPRQAVANIDHFLDLVAAHDDHATLGAVRDRLDAEHEHANYSPEAAIPEGSPGVQVMTVHAAKGDEFPVVIVPGIMDAYNTQSPINNSLEFEVIDGQPELGLQVPDPANPFESCSTVARQGIRDARMQRLQAEEKRVLYVACTRAEDHLILAGTHGGEITDTGNLNLDAADPDNPGSWGDLVQPLLLDDDLSELLASETGSLTRTLPGELQREGATVTPQYTISLPPRPAPIKEAENSPPSSLHADLTQVDPAAPTYRLAPSQLADLASDHADGELIYDADTNTIQYEGTAAADGGDEDADTMGAGASTGDATTGGGADDVLGGRVFGEAVHRICELQPPRSAWRAVIEDTLLAMDVEHEITATDESKVATHASRAITFVENYLTPRTRRYDELELTAKLPNGELYGFIDCLLVDDGDYHIIDYKTGDHKPEDLAEKTAYYQPQLDAYAAMLTATAHVDSITTTLYYTALDEARTTTYPGGIDVGEVERQIEQALLEPDINLTD